MTKIAVVLWATTGASGINSEIQSLEKMGEHLGHKYTIFLSQPWVNLCLKTFDRVDVRQGDVFAAVDGKMSHHPKHAESNAEFLNKNFDMVLIINGVPHPTKGYGEFPLFNGFLEKITLPISMRICDGYADSYRDWLELGLEQVSNATIAYSYRSTVEEYGVPGVHIPFAPDDPVTARSLRPHLSWVSQWKNIKGIKQFLKAVPDIEVPRLDMYSCGIEYYQLRDKALWKAAIGKDHFKGRDGDGKAHYYGYTHKNNLAAILQHTWAIVDFQGMGKAKYAVYNEGSINTTSIEALYYGACPIVAMNSPIPDELCIKVAEADIADVINYHLKNPGEKMLNPGRQKAAADYVEETFMQEEIYLRIIGLKRV